ncbi:MAG: sialidase family protein, partial [Dehalococcoidales bacterium]|nr:sialidase family protein [Dehalococcoidales bacterium]
MLEKVTDPLKVVTDSVMLSALAKQGIDKDFVEFFQDYAPVKLGKGYSPYAKFYRDLNSDKQFMVVSGLPMVDADGNKIEAGWRVAGINYFAGNNNLFWAKVQGISIELKAKNDQPDGRKANATLSFTPQLFLNGVQIQPVSSTPTLLTIDPLNPNYLENTLEWNYGIAKRRMRLIEGSMLGSWVFASKPNGEVRIKYNQTGDYKLKLGQFKVNNDEEIIKPEDFDKLARLFGYPVTISDSATFYPDAYVVSAPAVQFNTATWDYYSVLIQTGSDTILHFYTEASTEPASLQTDWLRIIKRTYTISTASWSALSVVYDRAPNLTGNPAGGIIGNNIYIFCVRADWVAGAWKNIDFGYIKSTDLTGTTWGDFVPLVTYGDGDTSISAMGHLVHISGDTYIISYHHIAGATYSVKMAKTTDAGANWTLITVVTGATKWNESSVAYIGSNQLISIMGNESGGTLGQATSADGGNTWSAVSNTNLGVAGAGVKIADVIYDNETNQVIVMFQDRQDSKVKASWEDADIIYASPTAWLTAKDIASNSSAGAGYPSIIKVSTKNYFYVY